MTLKGVWVLIAKILLQSQKIGGKVPEVIVGTIKIKRGSLLRFPFLRLTKKNNLRFDENNKKYFW